MRQRNHIVVRGETIIINGKELTDVVKLSFHRSEKRAYVDVAFLCTADVEIEGVEIRGEYTGLDNATCRRCGHDGGAHGSDQKCHVPECSCEQVEYGK